MYAFIGFAVLTLIGALILGESPMMMGNSPD